MASFSAYLRRLNPCSEAATTRLLPDCLFHRHFPTLSRYNVIL